MKNSLNSLENRIAKLLFKLVVEQAMMGHVLASELDIMDDTLAQLRGVCVQECKRTNGAISFENIVKFQNEWELRNSFD